MTRLDVGDTLEDFTLPSSTGTPITLSDVLREGPAVLVWYPFDFGRI